MKLLIELFSLRSNPVGSAEDMSSIPFHNQTTTEDGTGVSVSVVKLRLRSNPMKLNFFRKRFHEIVDHGLKRLQSRELDDAKEAIEHNDTNEGPQRAKHSSPEEASTLIDLIEKLNKA